MAFEKLENNLTQLVTINQIRKGTVELERSNFLKMSSIQTVLAAWKEVETGKNWTLESESGVNQTRNQSLVWQRELGKMYDPDLAP
jgi:hypothetical protein